MKPPIRKNSTICDSCGTGNIQLFDHHELLQNMEQYTTKVCYICSSFFDGNAIRMSAHYGNGYLYRVIAQIANMLMKEIKNENSTKSNS